MADWSRWRWLISGGKGCPIHARRKIADAGLVVPEGLRLRANAAKRISYLSGEDLAALGPAIIAGLRRDLAKIGESLEGNP